MGQVLQRMVFDSLDKNKRVLSSIFVKKKKRKKNALLVQTTS